MVGLNEWNDDLQIGESTELTVLKYIQKTYPKAYKIQGKKKEYDLVIPEINKTVEVKQDYKSHFTGNFMFEYQMYGKPSGLSVTTSNYWAHVDRDYIYFISTKILKALCEQMQIQTDEQNQAEFVLIPKYLFQIQPTVKMVPIEDL